ncbi:RNA 2',3'-cyclic phosphodiesterase [Rhodospirillum rubrum]|uniref:RNA 2',3'-cyclic phosphodiesterase n=1 Tax=Rhodospirillum rubrum TaxID=1085 RepID=UPI001905FEDC|nr:RNA 2',3'-cyclic phosphodiesterase [Rhodospirillum rubrum]MBK1663254.1 RNA 2',3'-cyclic phosphodiesterase [Rhodospirillum rubrum]MBK1676185.1 RNA 2',3'-cyclic phosphodiesterase [Rhodospirillum rubrum]
MVRLFIALTLDDSLRARLSGLEAGIPGARWAPAENLHVTLRFLGETEEGLAREIDAALLSVRADPFTLPIAGLGVFGGERRPRVLWAGVEKIPALTLLKGRIDATLRGLGVGPDEHVYAPHISLARLKKPDPERLQRFVEANNLSVRGSLPVASFSLFSSLLTGEGPLYREEAVYPLAAYRPEVGGSLTRQNG